MKPVLFCTQTGLGHNLKKKKKRKLQANVPDELRCKGPHQKMSKQKPTAH
jgi:hypothetical protein